MIEWFRKLSDTNKIAIVVPVGLAVIAGLFGLFKWRFGKADGPDLTRTPIVQKGSGHKTSIADVDVGTANIKVQTAVDSPIIGGDYVTGDKTVKWRLN